MPKAKPDSRYQSKEETTLNAHCANNLSLKVNTTDRTAVFFCIVLLTRVSTLT